MHFAQEIEIYFRSRCTCICIVSFEEERILQQLKSVCEQNKRTLYTWDHADFFQHLTGSTSPPPAAKDALSVLEAIEKMDGEAVVVLRDFHQCWQGQPRVIRKLRNLAHTLKYTRKTIVLTMPVPRVPEELKDDVVLLEFPSPGVAELESILKQLADVPGVKVNLTLEGREKIVRAALGLSSNQAQRVFAKAIVADGVLDERDIDLITAEKKQIIRESGALEFFAPTETIRQITVKASHDEQEHLGLDIYEVGRTPRADAGAVTGFDLVFDPSGAARFQARAATDHEVTSHFWVNEQCPTFINAQPRARKGDGRFPVQFSIDGNKRLCVTVRDNLTGKLLMREHPLIKLT